MVHVVLILFFLSQFPAFKKLDSGSKYGLNKYVSECLVFTTLVSMVCCRVGVC